MANKIQKSANSVSVSRKLRPSIASKFLTLLVLVMVAGAAYYFVEQRDTSGPNGKVVYIQMTDAGFVPETIVVSPGTTVAWQNSSASSVDITPISITGHTGHSFLPGFDGAQLSPGDEYHFIFELPGEFSYSNSDDHSDESGDSHNSDNYPQSGGKIIVQEL